MTRRRDRALVIAAGWAVVLAVVHSSAAVAGTARMEDGQLVFEAAPGERNDVSWDGDGALIDAGAPVVAGPGCSMTGDPHRVDCGRPGYGRLRLGDGDDALDGSGGSGPAQLAVEGGAGDDSLTGGPGRDEIRGEPGSDRVLGGAGDDRLDGGDDVRLDGGRRLVEPAPDLVDGGPGDDVLHGRHAADVLVGGPGADSLNTSDGGVNFSPIVPLAQDDRIDCGGGVDSLVADYADGYSVDCEFVDEGTPKWRRLPVGERPRLALKVRCAWRSSAPCRGSVRLLIAARATPTTFASGLMAPAVAPPAECRLAARSERLARTRFELRAGRVGRVVIPLPDRTRAVVRRRGCVPVLAHFAFADGAERYEATRSLTLSAVGRVGPNR